MQFDLSEEKANDKLVYTIYGKKGTGKTVTFLSFTDKVAVISFDHKTVTNKEEFFSNKKIRVYDGVRYMDRSPEKLTESSNTSFNYIKKIFQQYVNSEVKPDWIAFDGLEVLNNICEMAMRYQRQYKPYQGISNMNDWKYRNDMLAELHRIAFSIATKGVVYTTYTTQEEVINDGVVIEKKEIPKWFGSVLTETDIVLKTVVGEDIKGNVAFKVFCESSKKNKIMETGKTYLVSIEEGFIKQ